MTNGNSKCSTVAVSFLKLGLIGLVHRLAAAWC